MEWEPWTALAERTHIVMGWAALPGDLGAVYWPRGQRAAIIIDPRLSPVDRRAALTHELVHDERGGGNELHGMPPGWAAVVAREEHHVDQIVSDRLVPAAALAGFVDDMLAFDLAVSAVDVAEHFQVPTEVARRALEQLPETPDRKRCA